MNKPVAYVNNMCNDSIDWKVDPMDLEEQTPLYTAPQKYCPSENNAAYEKGFIDGMAKQRDSKVQQFVEAYVNKEDGLVCAKCFKPFDDATKPVAWMSPDGKVSNTEGKLFYIPLYTHPVKEQDDYCKAYWGNNNKFVDVLLPNSETEVIRFWNNTHPVKELTDEEIKQLAEENLDMDWQTGVIEFAKAILRKAQEK